jgi:hypothetical protein
VNRVFTAVDVCIWRDGGFVCVATAHIYAKKTYIYAQNAHAYVRERHTTRISIRFPKTYIYAVFSGHIRIYAYIRVYTYAYERIRYTPGTTLVTIQAASAS